MFTITQTSNGKAVTPDSPGDMLCTFCACLVPSEAEGQMTGEHHESLMVCLISISSCGSHTDKSLWNILFEK